MENVCSSYSISHAVLVYGRIMLVSCPTGCCAMHYVGWIFSLHILNVLLFFVLHFKQLKHLSPSGKNCLNSHTHTSICKMLSLNPTDAASFEALSSWQTKIYSPMHNSDLGELNAVKIFQLKTSGNNSTRGNSGRRIDSVHHCRPGLTHLKG